MQNTLLILDNVAANLSLTWRQKFPSRRLHLASVKFSATTLLSHQNEKSSIWSHLAFLQFFRLLNPEIALSPYFFGLDHFDRILELGEQTGPLQELFKNLLKMVPFYPRFFSY